MHSIKKRKDKENKWIYSREQIVYQTKKIVLIMRIFIDSIEDVFGVTNKREGVCRQRRGSAHLMQIGVHLGWDIPATYSVSTSALCSVRCE